MQRIAQLKTAAENATKHNPANFGTVLSQLIWRDLQTVITDCQNRAPGEAVCTQDGRDAWSMAMAAMHVALRDYFQSHEQ